MENSNPPTTSLFVKLKSDSSFVFGAINGLLALLLYIGIATFALSNNSGTSGQGTSSSSLDNTTTIQNLPSKPEESSSVSISSAETSTNENTSDGIRVNGIDLPLTNTL